MFVRRDFYALLILALVVAAIGLASVLRINPELPLPPGPRPVTLTPTGGFAAFTGPPKGVIKP